MRFMRDQIVEKIKQAGVVGAGGAGFPTHVKMNAQVDTVLVNGASCEPLLLSDIYLMEQEIETILTGLRAALDCTQAERGIICLKRKHKQALARTTQATTNGDPRISVAGLDDFYPAGDEHVLVREVLGRTVPQAGIPLQVGVVVSNVESIYNIAQALEDRPVTHRFLTVVGEVAQPMILKAPVGALVAEIIQFAGGSTVADYRVIDGGPMMGRVLADPEASITKTTSGLLVLSAGHQVLRGKTMNPEKLRRLTQSVCCQCSMCTDLCPRYLLGHDLHPHKLMRGFGANLVTGELAKEALLCSECGICEKFACPMLISPREVNVQIKQQLQAQGVRWPSSGQSPLNHPARENRYVPTRRLLQRLDMARYEGRPAVCDRTFVPSRLILPLKQHLGVPANAVVKPGDRVKPGDLVADIPDKALSARIHVGMEGVVSAVTPEAITIATRK